MEHYLVIVILIFETDLIYVKQYFVFFIHQTTVMMNISMWIKFIFALAISFSCCIDGERIFGADLAEIDSLRKGENDVFMEGLL